SGGKPRWELGESRCPKRDRCGPGTRHDRSSTGLRTPGRQRRRWTVAGEPGADPRVSELFRMDCILEVGTPYIQLAGPTFEVVHVRMEPVDQPSAVGGCGGDLGCGRRMNADGRGRREDDPIVERLDEGPRPILLPLQAHGSYSDLSGSKRLANGIDAAKM